MAVKKNNENELKGKILIGKIISISNPQTVIVEVLNVWRHPIYKKAMRRSHKYAVHAAGETPQIGETVKIAACKPISKTKHYLLI